MFPPKSGTSGRRTSVRRWLQSRYFHHLIYCHLLCALRLYIPSHHSPPPFASPLFRLRAGHGTDIPNGVGIYPDGGSGASSNSFGLGSECPTRCRSVGVFTVSYLSCLFSKKSLDVYLNHKTLHRVGGHPGRPRGPKDERGHGIRSVRSQMLPERCTLTGRRHGLCHLGCIALILWYSISVLLVDPRNFHNFIPTCVNVGIFMCMGLGRLLSLFPNRLRQSRWASLVSQGTAELLPRYRIRQLRTPNPRRVGVEGQGGWPARSQRHRLRMGRGSGFGLCM